MVELSVLVGKLRNDLAGPGDTKFVVDLPAQDDCEQFSVRGQGRGEKLLLADKVLFWQLKPA